MTFCHDLTTSYSNIKNDLFIQSFIYINMTIHIFLLLFKPDQHCGILRVEHSATSNDVAGNADTSVYLDSVNSCFERHRMNFDLLRFYTIPTANTTRR